MSPGFTFSLNGLPIVCTHLSKRERNRRHIKQSSAPIHLVLQHKNKGMLADEKKHARKEFGKHVMTDKRCGAFAVMGNH